MSRDKLNDLIGGVIDLISKEIDLDTETEDKLWESLEEVLDKYAEDYENYN